ncbi:MAG: hypothetical protein ACI8V5_004672, partial [Limisphaerales bacterium]
LAPLWHSMKSWSIDQPQAISASKEHETGPFQLP